MIYKRNEIFQIDAEIFSLKLPNANRLNRLNTAKIILALIVLIVVLIVHNILVLQERPFLKLKGVNFMKTHRYLSAVRKCVPVLSIVN